MKMWKDPYCIAREKVVEDIAGLLTGKYEARSIEVLPAVIRNEPLDLQKIAENAIATGVQNQFLYLLKITEDLMQNTGDEHSGINTIIKSVEKTKMNEDQLLGSTNFLEASGSINAYIRMCRKKQTPLMKECKVFGMYPQDSFKGQYELYKNGPATV